MTGRHSPRFLLTTDGAHTTVRCVTCGEARTSTHRPVVLAWQREHMQAAVVVEKEKE